jgi:hypothetical protein
MKTGTSLTLMAIGAIVAFAVTAHPSFLNLQVVGWVLIVTGVCGLLVPRRGHGWQRRSVLTRNAPGAWKRPEATSTQAQGDETAQQDTSIERESIVEYVEK